MKVRVFGLVCLCFIFAAAYAGAQSDPLSGTWSGDWGPSETHRNPVTVELSWDGSNLSGTVNPGPEAIELQAASFDASTGMIKMEAEAEGFRGAVHYVIEGKLEGNELTGSWNHERGTGTFRITKQ